MNRRLAGMIATAVALTGVSWAGVSAPAVAAPVTTPNPLVVVFDLSESMDDDDGTGTLKLQAAKDALNQLIDAQVRAGSVRQLGIWAYPGGKDVDGCTVGDWVPGAELKLQSNPTALSASVSTMATAAGGTPTGPALTAVAKDLRDRLGQNHATLVLVSDGLSNCGTPPCEVAQSLVDSGFDVTVNPVGFQVDPQGREELECIASATRGVYTDANDKDKLGDVIKQYATPEVGLQISLVNSSVSPGVPAELTATVSNASAVALNDVKLSVSAIGATSARLFPQIVPPQLALGNIPPGECPGLCTRTWSLPVGDLVGDSETATIKVVATADDAISAHQEIQVTVTKEGTAGTWLADALDNGSFDILGDSYSSGEGAGSYIDHADGSHDDCHRSVKTYIYNEFGRAVDDSILACSGAVINNVWGGTGQHGETTQLDQFAHLKASPDVVFLTIGGNDMEFATIVKGCVLGDCSDHPWDPVWKLVSEAALPALQTRLPNMYRDILSAVHKKDPGKTAQIVVLPYPQVLGTRWQGCGLYFNSREFRLAVDLVRRIDFVIQDAVAEVRAEGHTNLHYARGVLSLFPADDSACSSDPHVNPAGIGETIGRGISPDYTISEQMHPNARGHADISEALKAWAKTEPAGDDPETFDWVPDPVNPRSRGTIAFAEGTTGTVRVETGQTFTVTGGGFRPGTTVTATVASLPQALGTAVADDAGAVSFDVAIPRSLEPGAHTLSLSGLDTETANPRSLSRPLAAAAPAPWWLLPLLIVSALCLLGALAVFGFGLRGSLSLTARRPRPPKSKAKE